MLLVMVLLVMVLLVMVLQVISIVFCVLIYLPVCIPVQGSFEAGGDVIKDNAEIYRIVSKLLCSKDSTIQQVRNLVHFIYSLFC